jgi:hypothetical protein
MEFTCKVSYKDYREALRLKRKILRRVVYGLLLIGVLLCIYWMVLAARNETVKSAQIFMPALELVVWPLVYLGLLRLFAFFSYRKNRNIKSEFFFHLTTEELSYQSSAGGSGTTPWSSLSYWRESKGVFILVFPSGIFLICPKSFMASELQANFIQLVGTSLPKK